MCIRHTCASKGMQWRIHDFQEVRQPITRPNFPKNCTIRKKLGRGGAHPKFVKCISATGLYVCVCVCVCAVADTHGNILDASPRAPSPGLLVQFSPFSCSFWGNILKNNSLVLDFPDGSTNPLDLG